MRLSRLVEMSFGYFSTSTSRAITVTADEDSTPFLEFLDKLMNKVTLSTC